MQIVALSSRVLETCNVAVRLDAKQAVFVAPDTWKDGKKDDRTKQED